jgi:hypothetical protein
VGLTGAVACVVQHAKDRAYITATEHATEWGGFKKKVRSGGVVVIAKAVASRRNDQSTSSKDVHRRRTVCRSSTLPCACLPSLTWAICGLMCRAMQNSNSCPSSAALSPSRAHTPPSLPPLHRLRHSLPALAPRARSTPAPRPDPRPRPTHPSPVPAAGAGHVLRSIVGPRFNQGGEFKMSI